MAQLNARLRVVTNYDIVRDVHDVVVDIIVNNKHFNSTIKCDELRPSNARLDLLVNAGDLSKMFHALADKMDNVNAPAK
jgi:hypothetical protein